MATRAKVNKLQMKQQVTLVEYVRENFATSELDDKSFALRAAEVLGFPVTGANIQGIRAAYDIPPNMRADNYARARDRAEVTELRELINVALGDIEELKRLVKQLMHDAKTHR